MFSIKNGKLIMYNIATDYKNYLRQFDRKVSLKDDRKFYGILVSKDDIDYYIPFTSQVTKNTSSKLTVNIKDKGRVIAKLLLNNMIPVSSKSSSIVNINQEKYKNYYNKEIAYLRSNVVVNEILNKIDNIYNVVSNPNHKDYQFFRSICCDFLLLESKCMEYERVQNVLSTIKYIHNDKDLYYIYDKLSNKDAFEKCVVLLDNQKLKNNIQTLDISKFEKEIEQENK